MASVYTPENNPSGIPKQLHLIWIGSPIPQKYMPHLSQYISLTTNTGFEVNIWTDKTSYFQKALDTSEISQLSKLKVRNIEELKLD